MFVPNTNSSYRTSTSSLVQNNSQIGNDSSDPLAEEMNKLNRKVDELIIDQKNVLFEIKNLIKDNKQKDQEILELKELIKKLTENQKSNSPIKNNTIYDLDDLSMHTLIYCVEGARNWVGKGGEFTYENKVTIEFVLPFPKKFTLQITGGRLNYSKQPYEISIGRFDGKRHTQETQSFDGQRNTISVLFDTEEEDNNVIWITTLKNNDEYHSAEVYLSHINIIPR